MPGGADVAGQTTSEIEARDLLVGKHQMQFQYPCS
jgi:hypothetical protein